VLYVITGSCEHHIAAEVDMVCGMLCVNLYHCIVNESIAMSITKLCFTSFTHSELFLTFDKDS